MSNPQSKIIDVWVVEDNDEYRAILVEVVNNAQGMRCPQSFARCEEALAALEVESPPQVVLLDIGLPGMSGIDGINLIKSLSPATEIIMLTVYEDNDKIFQSICAGASGYLVKKHSADKIAACIREAHEGGAPMNAQIARRVLTMFSKMTTPREIMRLPSAKKRFSIFWLPAFPKK